jgi:predicted nucleotidyltransferase component of viral defense system
MNPAMESMLAKYSLRSADDHLFALREILQEIVLYGLWRAKFFEKAAFYGGTALRVLYQLDRFSEDLDFSLLATDVQFDLAPYCKFVEDELGAFGFTATVTPKEKSSKSAVQSAFLKANTQSLILQIDASQEISAQFSPNQRLRIKFEVDTAPPLAFKTENAFLLLPIPFSVRVFAPPSMHAGKMHAVLCRGWKNRVKGRDWYDMVWYAGRNIPVDLKHLEARMRQSGHLSPDVPLTEARLKQMLKERIDTLDVDSARRDVERFLLNPETVAVWSRPFLHAVANRLAVI